MLKEEAKKEVQRLLAQAADLVTQAESLMDEHRFTASFLGKEYCPRELTEKEIDDADLPIGTWMSEGDGGSWMSSSDMC